MMLARRHTGGWTTLGGVAGPSLQNCAEENLKSEIQLFEGFYVEQTTTCKAINQFNDKLGIKIATADKLLEKGASP